MEWAKLRQKNLVRDVLSTTFQDGGDQGEPEQRAGCSRTLLEANADTEFVVVEMGMRGLGQLEELCAREAGYFAYHQCGRMPYGALGSKENIARAKAEVARCPG